MSHPTQPELEALRYPLGRFAPTPLLDGDGRAAAIAALAALPADLRAAVQGLDERRLDTPYRPGGWTGRQVVHHVADSHMNSYIRFKLAVTEDRPSVSDYDEGAWATLPDARSGPIADSLDLIQALHGRWVRFLEALSPEDFRRTFVHPARGELSVDLYLQLYAWHGRHHAAHIRSLEGRGS